MLVVAVDDDHIVPLEILHVLLTKVLQRDVARSRKVFTFIDRCRVTTDQRSVVGCVGADLTKGRVRVAIDR